MDSSDALINSGQPVILFDGVCNLCSGAVQFIIRHDPKAVFRFASLQSEYGQSCVARLGYDPNELQSIILIKGHEAWRKSDAALQIAAQLSGGWPALVVFRIVPRFIRDAVYDWIARKRYSFFGKKDSCWLPTPELRARFLA